MFFHATDQFVRPEMVVIEAILERAFCTEDPSQFINSITGFDGKENPAGRLFDVIHVDFDIRKMKF